MSIKKLMSGLLTKADSTANSYVVALEEKQERLMQLNLQLQEEQVKLKEFHKLSLTKQITEETYLEQKLVVTSMNEKINTVQFEMKQIDLYKTEDVDSVLAEIQANRPEFNKKKQAEIQQIKLEIAQARNDYLAKLSALGKQYDDVTNADSLIQQLLVDFGKQPNMYLPYKMEIIGAGASVSAETVNQVL